MLFFRFRTFTTTYFFPELRKGQEYMYGLYSPYGGLLSRIYWLLFRNCSIVRHLTVVDERKLPFPYNDIRRLDGTDCLMAFNMGSPGVEQKISILGYDNQTGKPFFAKYSQQEKAKELTRHETVIYQNLEDTGLTPRLLKYEEDVNGIYMKAEYVEGKRPEIRLLNEGIIDVAIEIGHYHIDETAGNGSGLETCLSHGDFCPWNFLVSDGRYKLIDWELAAERPLGYDLLTYICNVSALFEHQTPLAEKIKENEHWLSSYFNHFGITDYHPYVKAFAKEKAEYERGKGNELLAVPYESLLATL